MANTILVPIDISEGDMTRQVIPFVEASAAMSGAKVHFLTVIPSYPYYKSLGIAYSAGIPKKSEMQKEALLKLDEIVKQFNLPNDRVQTHAISGIPKDKILSLAEAISADLIIIASHRPGISTYLLGSNAEVIVRHAKCSVLVVR